MGQSVGSSREKEHQRHMTKRIDAFAHALPKGFQTTVIEKLGGSPSPRWESQRTLTDVPMRLEIMDECEVDMQIVSYFPPPLEAYLEDANEIQEAASLLNDGMADVVQMGSGRLVGVATVSLLDVDKAIDELERSVRELNLKGVTLFSDVRGKPLDCSDFDPFFTAVEELDVPVWLHPVRDPKTPDYPGETSSRYLLWYVFGWPYQSALAMARLVFSGTLRRHPRLKIITHHGGGMVPFFATRIKDLYRESWSPTLDVDPNVRQDYMAHFQRFYADTVTLGSVSSLMSTYEMFGADHMVFGTDMPMDPEQGMRSTLETVRAIERMMIPDKEKQQIWSENIIDLCGLT